MTFAQNCDMMEKTGRTRQGLPARFAIGYSQFIIRIQTGPLLWSWQAVPQVHFCQFLCQVGTFTVL